MFISGKVSATKSESKVMEGINELEPLAGVILISLSTDAPSAVITQLDYDWHITLIGSTDLVLLPLSVGYSF